MESKTIKVVPETLEDITAEWCEKILHEGGTISKETKVLCICNVAILGACHNFFFREIATTLS